MKLLSDDQRKVGLPVVILTDHALAIKAARPSPPLDQAVGIEEVGSTVLHYMIIIIIFAWCTTNDNGG